MSSKSSARYIYALLVAWGITLCICHSCLTPARAQELPLEIKGEIVTVVKKLPFVINAPAGYDLYFWSFPATVNAAEIAESKGASLQVTTAPKGLLTISVKCLKVDWDSKKLTQKFGSVNFAIGGETPVPPIPPDPPDPPDPPKPIPSPIPVEGLHVLMVYETADLAKLPQATLNILYTKSVRDYLNSKCTVDSDGKNKAWRIWDKDIDTTNANKKWQDALARAKGKQMPWLIISNHPKGGYEGPLPATVDETLTLLKKFGG